MPHIIVKMYSGKSQDDKARIADQIAKAMVASAPCSDAAVSVSIQDIEPRDWVDTVFKPDIVDKPEELFKKPGYDPLS